jgi:hypothetical protein
MFIGTTGNTRLIMPVIRRVTPISEVAKFMGRSMARNTLRRDLAKHVSAVANDCYSIYHRLTALTNVKVIVDDIEFEVDGAAIINPIVGEIMDDDIDEAAYHTETLRVINRNYSQRVRVFHNVRLRQYMYDRVIYDAIILRAAESYRSSNRAKIAEARSDTRRSMSMSLLTPYEDLAIEAGLIRMNRPVPSVNLFDNFTSVDRTTWSSRFSTPANLRDAIVRGVKDGVKIEHPRASDADIERNASFASARRNISDNVTKVYDNEVVKGLINRNHAVELTNVGSHLTLKRAILDSRSDILDNGFQYLSYAPIVMAMVTGLKTAISDAPTPDTGLELLTTWARLNGTIVVNKGPLHQSYDLTANQQSIVYDNVRHNLTGLSHIRQKAITTNDNDLAQLTAQIAWTPNAIDLMRLSSTLSRDYKNAIARPSYREAVEEITQICVILSTLGLLGINPQPKRVASYVLLQRHWPIFDARSKIRTTINPN